MSREFGREFGSVLERLLIWEPLKQGMRIVAERVGSLQNLVLAKRLGKARGAARCSGRCLERLGELTLDHAQVACKGVFAEDWATGKYSAVAAWIAPHPPTPLWNGSLTGFPLGLCVCVCVFF